MMVRVFVDGNGFYMRNWSVFKSVMKNGGVYGYLKNFSLLMGRINMSWGQTYHFFDGSKAKARRRMILAEYKANRAKSYVEDVDDLFKGMNDLRDYVLSFLGAATFYHEDLEADDLIAQFTKLVLQSSSDDEVVIVSDDSDLWQLLDLGSRVKIYNRAGWVDLMEHTGCVSGREWMMVKVLSGDKVDNIPPVAPGIGRRTALKLLRTGAVKPEWSERMAVNERVVNLLDTVYDDVDMNKLRIVYPARNEKALMEYLIREGLRLEILFSE